MLYKLTTLPNYEEMRRRLVGVRHAPHIVEKFYPLILHYAGEEWTGPEIFYMLLQAMIEYTEGLPLMRLAMWADIPLYIKALVDDEEVQTAALDVFEATERL